MNEDKFIKLLRYGVRDDLRVYGKYLPGLLIRSTKTQFDADSDLRQEVKMKLEDMAKKLGDQFDRHKQPKDIDKYNEEKLQQSALWSSQPIPLFEDDGVRDPKEEYWDYLTSVWGAEIEPDGLLHWLHDIFKNI